MTIDEVKVESEKEEAKKQEEDKILFRSRDDYMFAGVIGGLAYFWGMNSTTLRLLFLGLSLITGGIAIIVYLILMRIIPLEPEIED
ncbi:MAG: PspC domain-containing protein [Asgard group archaeon]|nr:PspC domain-containing protein [Asgard group archaeon]